MAGFGRKPTRGDGYSNRKAKECLRHDWRFRDRDPATLADEWRSVSFASWDERRRRKQEAGIVLTREALFQREDEFVWEEDQYGDQKNQSFSGGFWMAYIDDSKEMAKKSTRDWGICIKVGEFNYMTGAGAIRKLITESLGEETYEEFKTALMDDLNSLTECMNKGSAWLEEEGLLGVSFVCSESSERLLRRLRIRVERGWAFWFPHYSW